VTRITFCSACAAALRFAHASEHNLRRSGNSLDGHDDVNRNLRLGAGDEN